MDILKKRTIGTMKKYCPNKPDTTYVQIRLFMRKNEAEKIEQLVFVKNKPDDFLFLLHVINSLSEKTLLNQSFCNNV